MRISQKKSKSYKLLLIAAFSFYFFIFGSGFAAEELRPPTITINPDVYYPLDEILYIEGRAVPNVAIQIQFQKSGAKPVNLNIKSDTNGEWVLAEKVPLEKGDWEVRARVVLNSGATSEWSNPRVLKAISTGFVIGGFTVKYAFLLFLFLVVLTFSIILILYFFFRMKRYRERIEAIRIRELEKKLAEKTEKLEEALLDKEKEETETILKKNFAELKAAILTELEHLEEAAGGRPLSKEELEHKEHLFGRLKEAEEKIESKIKSIDAN